MGILVNMAFLKNAFLAFHTHVTAFWITDWIIDFDIYESFKSCHSTETTLLIVLNDELKAVVSGNTAALILSDLAAFDTVSYSILLSCLEQSVGIRRSVMCIYIEFSSNAVM